MSRYLMRFDDINPEMDWERFFLVKKILEQYNIKSILGVVPNCKDKNLSVAKPFTKYYQYLRKYKAYGDIISQHGYQHIYDSKVRGKFGSSNNSEFAGHSLKNQYEKLMKGKNILKKHLIWDPVFMAPAHSFDKNTLLALRKLNFKTVLDGFSLYSYKENGIKFVPQISSKPLPIFLPGISQLCIHINTITDKEINNLIKFIEKNHNLFISLHETSIINKFVGRIEKIFVFILIKLFRFIRELILFLINNFKKIRCLTQRFIYRIKFRKINLYKWHLEGTFYCRKYKMLSLEIINNLKPKLYIDIGCGLGEILTKVNINPNYKLGYDIDLRLVKYYKKYKEKEYKFFTDESLLLRYAKSINIRQDDLIVISMLNFVHQINQRDLVEILKRYKKDLGKFILIIDNIKNNSKEYKYDHNEFLHNNYNLIKYWHEVDQLRSLYCFKIG